MYNKHKVVFEIKSSLEKKWSLHYKEENCLPLNIKLCELSSGKTLCKVTLNFPYEWDAEIALDPGFVCAQSSSLQCPLSST